MFSECRQNAHEQFGEFLERVTLSARRCEEVHQWAVEHLKKQG